MQAAQQTELEAMTDMFNKCVGAKVDYAHVMRHFCDCHAMTTEQT